VLSKIFEVVGPQNIPDDAVTVRDIGAAEVIQSIVVQIMLHDSSSFVILWLKKLRKPRR
jgi:hypothetical protein